MNLMLNCSEGADHIALLKRVDFRNISGPLSVELLAIDIRRGRSVGGFQGY